MNRQHQLTGYQESRNAVLASRKREARIIPELGAPYGDPARVAEKTARHVAAAQQGAPMTATEVRTRAEDAYARLARHIAIFHQNNSMISYRMARALVGLNDLQALLLQAHGAEASRLARLELGIE